MNEYEWDDANSTQEIAVGDFLVNRTHDRMWNTDTLSITDESFTSRYLTMTRSEAELLRDALNKLYPVPEPGKPMSRTDGEKLRDAFIKKYPIV